MEVSMPISDEDREAAVNTIKKLRERERRAFELRPRANMLKGEQSTDDANVRLYNLFKAMDRFNASSLTRGCKEAAY
ncbi:MAG: hypothetical protein ACD_15C00185G0006 [uncultured bacterium]|nr:MAG: hypothetical protein ACD_15C00185G0006 [uncultured bacterium]